MWVRAGAKKTGQKKIEGGYKVLPGGADIASKRELVDAS